MAKFSLGPDEHLIGEGWMAYRHRPFLGSYRWRNESTRVHVTDRRVVCRHWMGLVYMDEPLSNIRGFQMSYLKGIHIPCLRLYCRGEESYLFADFRVQKLRRWLLEAGVQEYPAIKRKKYPFLYGCLRRALYILLAFWLVLGAFPTGWIYDLGAGTGTEQGQRPNGAVRTVTGQGELEALRDGEVPATARGDTFMRCPLMFFRWAEEAGGSSNAYYTLQYPFQLWQTTLVNFGLKAQYSSCYLLELEDSSWLCVRLDDYRMLGNLLGGEVRLPAGRVRRATKTEGRMLSNMADYYPYYSIETAYVLDTYPDGRVFALDAYLRIALAAGSIWLLRRAEKKFILPKLAK